MLFRNKRWIGGAAFIVAVCVIASFYFIYDILLVVIIYGEN